MITHSPTPAAARPSETVPPSLPPLLTEAYDELRRLARAYLRQERPDHTLPPTALVHEAYLRLRHAGATDIENRIHAINTIALAMRRILLNHARDRNTQKRGGRRTRTSIDDALAVVASRCTDLAALDDALQRLAAAAPRPAAVVEMRFFGGFTMPEIARALDCAVATVERDWAFARAWLRTEIADDAS